MTENPILYSTKDECCGCGVCGAICPVGAISMVMDKMGYLYPNINEQLCLKCGQCISICAFK